MSVNRLNQLQPWWGGLSNLHRDLFQIFGRDLGFASLGESGGSFPPMRIWEDADSIHVEAPVPGMDMKDLEITVNNSNEVSIKGERLVEKTGEKDTWHRKEREYGKFSRTLRMPFPVDGDKVDAKLENGVLKLLLPRHEAAKGRKIPVKIN